MSRDTPDAADLEHLSLSATGRIRGTGGFVVGGEKSDGTARLRQPVRAQIATVLGHELLDARRGDLREQIANLLIVAARAERFHDFPVIHFLLQFHFAHRGL